MAGTGGKRGGTAWGGENIHTQGWRPKQRAAILGSRSEVVVHIHPRINCNWQFRIQSEGLMGLKQATVVEPDGYLVSAMNVPTRTRNRLRAHESSPRRHGNLICVRPMVKHLRH